MEIRPHARNLDFRWSSPAGPFRRITPEQARQWNEDGNFVLEDAFARLPGVDLGDHAIERCASSFVR